MQKILTNAILLLLVFTLPVYSAEIVKIYNASGGANGQPFNFSEPYGLAIGGGNIYVSDPGSASVVGLSISDDKVVARIGGEGVTKELFFRPQGMFYSPEDGYIYVADPGKQGVIVYLGNSASMRVGPLASAQRTPSAAWVESKTMWLIDTRSNIVMEYDLTTGRNVRDILEPGIGSGKIDGARDIAFGVDRIYVADTNNNRVQVFDKNFKWIDDMGTGRGGVMLSAPYSVASDGDKVFVADTNNNRVVVFGSDGYPIEIIGESLDANRLSRPTSVRIHDSMLYVLDSGNKRVMQYRLNFSLSSPKVMAELDEVNRSVSNHEQNIIRVMDMLGISHAPFGAPSKLARAYSQMLDKKYFEASSSIAEAKAELDAMRLQHVQALRASMQKDIDYFWGIIDSYKSVKLGPEQAYRQNVLINRINSMQERLNSEDYSEAARLDLALKSDLAIFRSEMETAKNSINATERAQAAPNPVEELILSQVDSARARHELARQSADELRQNVSLDQIRVLIDSAESLAKAGAYNEANTSIVSANSALDSVEKKLAEKRALISNATGEIDMLMKTVNDSSVGWTAMGVNSQPIMDRLNAAQRSVYDSPEEARRLAQEAMELAKIENSKAQSKGATLGWMGIALVAVVGVGIAAWALMKTRKRGLGE